MLRALGVCTCCRFCSGLAMLTVSSWVKKCMEYEVEGSRPRGTPKRTWREVVQKDCQARNLNREDAVDRGRWKKLIKIGWWSGWWVVECFLWYQGCVYKHVKVLFISLLACTSDCTLWQNRKHCITWLTASSHGATNVYSPPCKQQKLLRHLISGFLLVEQFLHRRFNC